MTARTSIRALGSMTTFAISAAVAAACASGAPGSTSAPTTSAVPAPTAAITLAPTAIATAAAATVSATPVNTQAPVATPPATAGATPTAPVLLLPGNVTFGPLSEFSNVRGEGSFEQLSSDEISISIELETDDPMTQALGYTALLLEGACSDQTEPADFEGALAQSEVFDGDATGSLVVSATDLAALLTAPHAILITNGPGDLNLACADVGRLGV